MSSAARRWAIAGAAIVVIGAGAGVAAWRASHRQAPAVAVTPPPPPATEPAPPALPPAPRTYLEVIRLHHPAYPATQPGPGVDLQDAAHVRLTEPVYVCSHGELWITRADARPTAEVLQHLHDDDSLDHVLTDRVVYVHWRTSDAGRADPVLVCVAPGGGGYDVVTTLGRTHLPFDRPFDWRRALSWDDRVIVPAGGGVSVLSLGNMVKDDSPLSRQHGEPPREEYTDLAVGASGAKAQTALPPDGPQLAFDARGFLAWLPADPWTGSTRVARYVDGHWVGLEREAGWGGQVIQLVPLLDGSVLQISRNVAGAGTAAGDDAAQAPVPDAAALSILPLDQQPIDAARVATLVSQLSDDDADVRKRAFEKLTEYGPGLWPVLDALPPDPSPETQARLRELRSMGLAPRLGGMTINNNRLRVVARLSDGGVVLLAPDGVTIPRDRKEPLVVKPEVLAIRPGFPVRELPTALWREIDPDSLRPGGPAFRIGSVFDEYVVTRDENGPQRFTPPNDLTPLLRPGERDFTELAAIASRGRWVFRRPLPRHGDGDAPAATLPTTQVAPEETLVLDPTLPDPTPQLAVWTISTGQPAGWDEANWPVVTRLGDPWAIGATDWRLLDRRKSPLRTLYVPSAYETALAARPPATSPASTNPTTAPSGPLLLRDPAGNCYYDGVAGLTVVRPDGRVVNWPFPAGADLSGTGEFQPWLVRCPDGALLLYNAPGRLIHLRPGPDPATPFVVGGVFTKGIPPATMIQRLWLDPAGRVDMAYDGNKMVILFPDGRIPPPLLEKILPKDLHRSATDEE